MTKLIKLKESDITRLVKRLIQEQGGTAWCQYCIAMTSSINSCSTPCGANFDKDSLTCAQCEALFQGNGAYPAGLRDTHCNQTGQPCHSTITPWVGGKGQAKAPQNIEARKGSGSDKTKLREGTHCGNAAYPCHGCYPCPSNCTLEQCVGGGPESAEEIWGNVVNPTGSDKTKLREGAHCGNPSWPCHGCHPCPSNCTSEQCVGGRPERDEEIWGNVVDPTDDDWTDRRSMRETITREVKEELNKILEKKTKDKEIRCCGNGSCDSGCDGDLCDTVKGEWKC